jgi:hypothetical protein
MKGCPLIKEVWQSNRLTALAHEIGAAHRHALGAAQASAGYAIEAGEKLIFEEANCGASKQPTIQTKRMDGGFVLRTLRLCAFSAESERRGDVAGLCWSLICSSVRSSDRDICRMLPSGESRQARIRSSQKFRVHLLTPARFQCRRKNVSNFIRHLVWVGARLRPHAGEMLDDPHRRYRLDS